MTSPFPIAGGDHCRECNLSGVVAVNTAEIKHLKESNGRVESKLDKLLWWIMGALATSAGTLLVLLIKK